MQQQGYTIVWFGWQPDVVAGNNRMTMQVPIARNPDGSPITGVVRNELIVSAPTTTLALQSGWFTPASKPYPNEAARREPGCLCLSTCRGSMRLRANTAIRNAQRRSSRICWLGGVGLCTGP